MEGQMTDEQINLAIHKAVGFVWNDDRKLWERNANKARVVSHNPFYYSSDLNLMHEAESTLTEDQLWIMARQIERNWEDQWYFRATARQRAEAFLKALDKWEEAK
jgi:hypothetical protein